MSGISERAVQYEYILKKQLQAKLQFASHEQMHDTVRFSKTPAQNSDISREKRAVSKHGGSHPVTELLIPRRVFTTILII